LPHVHIPVSVEGHFSRLQANLARLGTAGSLTTDAHLATLAKGTTTITASQSGNAEYNAASNAVRTITLK
jgi:purine-nucleoside phosphorylase